MTALRQNLAELVRALCVLALVFLSFGHQAMAFGPADQASPSKILLADGTVPIFCGQSGPQGDPGQHDPCPLYSIGAGFDLPAPPSNGALVFVGVSYIAYGHPRVVRVAPALVVSAQPRGPPLV